MPLRVTRSVSIPESELEYSYMRSGGPGGQHANKTSTKVEVTWDVENSSAIGPIQRERLLTNLGSRIEDSGLIRLRSDRHRSQTRNKEDVTERLRVLIEKGLQARKSRTATAPSKGAKQKRLDSKKRRSDVKRARRKPSFDD